MPRWLQSGPAPCACGRARSGLWCRPEGPPHYEVFVGPPGVGKTTTIAKIAAQECARRGTPLNLIAADAFRAGAIEQLRSYAAVMGSPLRIARSTAEFEEALSGSRQTALVDTAGRSPKDAELSSLFEVLKHKRGVRTHLVLAADTSPRPPARRLLDAYAPLQPARVVITKLDESESMMPLFDAVRERGLPVSYLTAGQRVPEDLWRATPATWLPRSSGSPLWRESRVARPLQSASARPQRKSPSPAAKVAWARQASR